MASHAVGRNLLLIGGFRYRLLEKSPRTSVDIAYHWNGDLDAKMQEIVTFGERTVLPKVRQNLRFDGAFRAVSGPDNESPNARVVNMVFWKPDLKNSQIVIPLEITHIVCSDPVMIKTLDGVIYPTVSNADSIESKIIAVFNRVFLQHRDLLDIFLYSNQIIEEAPKRIAHKLHVLSVGTERIAKRLADLRLHREYHGRAVQDVINSQLEAAVAEQINNSGGGLFVLDTALQVIEKNVIQL